jgi:hypothetical protein
VLSWLAVSSVAFAEAGEVWRSDAHLDVPLTYVQGASQLQATARLNGSWYFKPLFDDGRQPLALLGFIQHPDTATLTVSGVSLASVSGVAYPWLDTGLTASLSSSVGLAPTGTSASYSAGILHYFSPSFRLQLLYLGARGTTWTSSTRDELQSTSTASDRGHVDAALLLGERALLSLTVEAGSTRADSRFVPTAVTTLSTSTSRGITSNATLSATGYFGRRLSGALAVGARYQAPDLLAGSGTPTTTLVLVGSLNLQYFVTDALYLRLVYEADHAQTTAGTSQRPGSLTHLLTATVGARF